MFWDCLRCGFGCQRARGGPCPRCDGKTDEQVAAFREADRRDLAEYRARLRREGRS
jgi:ribosomal protein L44E